MGPQLDEASSHVFVAQGAVPLGQQARHSHELVPTDDAVPGAEALI